MSFKRILALVLALTMCFSIVFPGGVAFAEEGDNGGAVTVVNDSNENNVENNENAGEGQEGGQQTPTEPEIPETPAAETNPPAEEQQSDPIPTVSYVAFVEGEGYTSFEAAAAAAGETKVITLNADVEYTFTEARVLLIAAGDFTFTAKAAEGIELTASEADENGVVTYTAVLKLAIQPIKLNENGVMGTPGEGGSGLSNETGKGENTPLTPSEFIEAIANVTEYSETVTVKFTNDNVSGGNNHSDGYQVYLLGGYSPLRATPITISNVTFDASEYTGNAVGIQLYLYTSANVTFENCIFKNVSVSMNGASATSKATFKNCEFNGVQNYALKYFQNLEVTGCTFDSCKRAILVWCKDKDSNSPSSVCKIEGCTFNNITEDRIIKFYEFYPPTDLTQFSIKNNTVASSSTAKFITVDFDNPATAATTTYRIPYTGNTGITQSNLNDNTTEKTLYIVSGYLIDTEPVAATGITVAETASVYAGETTTLAATLEPANSTDTVSWSSADTSIATVTSAGVVTGVSAGEVVITATAGTASDTCTVTVMPMPVEVYNANNQRTGAYKTLTDAVAAVKSNETIVILSGVDMTGETISLSSDITGVTIKGESAETPVVVSDLSGIAATAKNLTFQNIHFKKTGSTTMVMRGEDITFQYCDFTQTKDGVMTSLKSAKNFKFEYCDFEGTGFGSGTMIGDDPSVTNLSFDHCTVQKCYSFIYYGYLYGDVVVKNSDILSYAYVVHTGNGLSSGTRYTFENVAITGWFSYGNEVEDATFTNCEFRYNADGYNYMRPYHVSKFERCVFEKGFRIDVLSKDMNHVVKDCYYRDGETNTLLTAANYTIVLSTGSENEYSHASAGPIKANVASINNESYVDLTEAIAVLKDSNYNLEHFFYIDPSSQLESGYVGVKCGDTFVIGTLTKTAAVDESTKTNTSAEYVVSVVVNSTVSDDSGDFEELAKQDALNVSVVAVTEVSAESGNTAVNNKLTNIDEEVLEKIVESAIIAGINENKDMDGGTVKVVVQQDNKQLDTSGSVAKVSFDVDLLAVAFDKDGTKVSETKIPNSAIIGSYTFDLDVTDLDVNVGGVVEVLHNGASLGSYVVNGTATKKFVTVTTSSFSTFTVQYDPTSQETYDSKAVLICSPFGAILGGYDTLALAFAAKVSADPDAALLADGNVVVLNANVSISKKIALEDVNTTLELYGHELEVGSAYGIALGESANLVLRDSSSGGKITSTKSDCAAIQLTDRTASFTMESGKIELSGNASSGIYVTDGATVTMNGGSIEAAVYGIHAKASTVTVTGGSVKAATALYNSGDGNTNISGADTSIDGSTYAVNNLDGGIVTITSGRIDGTLQPNSNPDLMRVSGGTFSVDPDAYVVDGKISWPNSETSWTVLPATTITFNAGEGATLIGEGSFKVAVSKSFNDHVNKGYEVPTAKKANYGFDNWYKTVEQTEVAFDPTAAITESAAYTAKWITAEAQVGDNYYATLAEAFAAAGNDSIVRVLAENPTINETISISKNLTVDLGGHTITNNGTGYAFEVSNAQVKFLNGTINGSGKGIKATGSSSFVRLGEANENQITVNATGRALGLYDGASATLYAGSTLSTSVKGDVTVFMSKNTTFNVYGTVAQTCTETHVDNNAISGNGNANQHDGTTLNIYPGASVSAASASAIYQPQNGATNIYGGTISGPTAVYVKCGTLNISDGALNGTGTATPYQFYGNGSYPTGDALVVDNCAYPGTPAVVTITGGEFNSAQANGIAGYIGNTATNLATVTATTDSISKPADEKWVYDEDDDVYVLTKIWKVTFDADGGTPEPSPVPVVNGNAVAKPTTDPVKEGAEFGGWYKVTDATTTPVTLADTAYDFATPVESDLTLKAKWLSAVASVTTGDVTSYYASLTDAFGHAVDGSTITLLETVSETTGITIPASTAITLDLNGKTINSSADDAFVVNGELTVKNGNIAHTGNYDAFDNYGTLTIESNAVITSSNGKYGAIYNRGTLNNAGSVTSTRDNQYAIRVISGTANITGEVSGAYGIVANGTVNVSGSAKITGTVIGIQVNSGGTADVSGGEVSGAYGLYNLGTATVSGTAKVSGTTYAIYAKESSTTISGGEVSNSNGTAVGAKDATLNVTGGTISATKDDTDAIQLTGSTVATISGGTVTGHDWGVTLFGESKLTVSDDAVIGTAEDEGYGISTNGNAEQRSTVTVTGGTITGAELGIYQPSGTLNISGGNITGATGVYFKSQNLSISGGTINGTGTATAYKYNGNGANKTGDALVIDSCNYPNGITGVSVTGGTFNSSNAKAVASYTVQDDPDHAAETAVRVEEFVSAVDGTPAPKFSSVVDATYCAEGFIPQTQASGGMYSIQTGWKVSFDLNGGTGTGNYSMQCVPDGQKATKPAVDPTKAEFEFDSWCVVSGDPETWTPWDFNEAPTADVTLTAKWNGAVASVTKDQVTTYYDSLAKAFAAVGTNEMATITMLDSVTLNSTIEVAAGRTITLDLNGKTVTAYDDANKRFVVNGDLTLTDLSTNGGGKILDGTAADGVSNAAMVKVDNNGKLTVAASATIEGHNYAVGVFKQGKLDVYGTITSDALSAISTNGNSPAQANSSEGTEITINNGAVVTSNDIAVYLPAGELTVNGGTITGKTGIYAKGGKLTIPATSTAVITGNGAHAEFVHTGDGAKATGDALVIENTIGYEYSPATVSVAGGTFKSTQPNTVAVSSFAYGDNKLPVTGFVSGGSFSSQLPLAYCETGYMPSEKGAGNMYGVVNATPVVMIPAVTSGENAHDAKYFAVGEDYYADNGTALRNAIAAAVNGDTVEILVENQTFALDNTSVTIATGITLEGNGNTITASYGSPSMNGNLYSDGTVAFGVNTTEKVQIQNLKINAWRGVSINSAKTDTFNIEISNVDMTVSQRGVSITNGGAAGSNLAITDCNIVRLNFNVETQPYVNDGSDGMNRGISLWQLQNSTVTITRGSINGFTYGVNVAGTTPSSNNSVTATGTSFTGRAAMNTASGNGNTFNFTGCVVNGWNGEGGPTESFGCFVNGYSAGANTYILDNCTVSAHITAAGIDPSGRSNATEYLFVMRGSAPTVLVKGNTTYTVNNPARGGFDEYIDQGTTTTAKFYLTPEAETALKTSSTVFEKHGISVVDNETTNVYYNQGYTRKIEQGTPVAQGVYQYDADSNVHWQNFYTVQDAIDYALTNNTYYSSVTLLADVTENVTIPANANLVFDLFGRELSSTSGDTITIAQGASLLLQDASLTVDDEGNVIVPGTGKVTATGTDANAIKVETGADITLVYGTISGINAGILNDGGMVAVSGGTVTGGYAGIVTNGGEVGILGGTVGVTNGYYAIRANGAAEVNVFDGTVGDSSHYGGIRAADTTEVYVEGGRVLGNDYGIVIMGKAQLEVAGGIVESTAPYSATYGDGNAISSNGSNTNPTASTTITGGTIRSNNVAIYNPAGDLTIVGGTITGATGVYTKSGSFKMPASWTYTVYNQNTEQDEQVVVANAAEITGNGVKVEYKYYNNGCYPTGDAIVVDSCDYPNGAPSVEINGYQTITSENGKQIGYYEANTSASTWEAGVVKATTNTLTIPDGLAWKKIAENEYQIASAVASVTTSGETPVTTYYATLQGAIDAARELTGNVTITLLSDTSEKAVLVWQKAGLNLTITGALSDEITYPTLYGQIAVAGNSSYTADTLTIQNLNFEYNTDGFEFYTTTSNNYDPEGTGFVVFPSFKNQTHTTLPYPFYNGSSNPDYVRYAHNVTVSNCTFNSKGSVPTNLKVSGVYAEWSNSPSDVSVNGVTAYNMYAVAAFISTQGVRVTNNTGNNMSNGIVLSNCSKSLATGAGAVISGNTITAENGWGINIQKNENGDIALSGNKIIAKDALYTPDSDDSFAGNINVGTDEDYTGNITINRTEAIVNLNDGTVTGNVSTIGTLNITGTDVTGNVTSSGTATISGGSVSGTVESTDGTLDITGGSVGKVKAEGIGEGDKTVISGGMISGEVTKEDQATLEIKIDDDTPAPIFKYQPALECCVDCYPVANIDEATKGDYPWTVQSGDAVAYTVDSETSARTYYTDLQTAVDAAAEANDYTVHLTDNVALASSLSITKKVVIDGTNGTAVYTIKAGDTATSVNPLISVPNENGDLTLQNVKIDANEKGRAIRVLNGKLTVNAGTEITGGNPGTSYIGGVFMTGKSTFVMNGGKITGNDPGSNYTNDGFFQYAADLWIGSEAKGTMTGGTVDNVFVNANEYSTDEACFTLNDGTVTNAYVEYDTGEHAQLVKDGGSIGMLKIAQDEYDGSVAGCHSEVQWIADPANDIYNGGSAVARIGAAADNMYYPTLAAAVTAAADSGDTITLIADVALTATQEITKSLTIDLNGHNITATDARALHVKSGVVAITNSGTADATHGVISANGTALDHTSSVIRVGDSSANTNKAKLTIGQNVTVSSEKSFGVTVFGKNDDGVDGADMTLVVNGTISVSGSEAAISGNGTSTLKPTDISVASTANVSSANTYAIYHPGGGTLTVAGTVTGFGGIEAKGGTVTIEQGASITANAEQASYPGVNNDGSSTSGYAIASVGNGGYVNGPAKVTINGATVNGKIFILEENNATGIGSIEATATANAGTPEDGYAWHKVSDNKYVLSPVVAKIGDVGYASLAEAVEAAQSGNTIEVVADDHVSFATTGKRIRIDKSLTITGATNEDGTPKYTIYGHPTDLTAGMNMLFVKNLDSAMDVSISNLAFTEFGHQGTGVQMHAAVIYVATGKEGTNVTFTNLHLDKFNRDGIRIYQHNFEIDGCVIDCDSDANPRLIKGIALNQGATGTVKNCVIKNSFSTYDVWGSAAIESYEGCTVTIDGCQLLDNENAVLVDGYDTEGTVKIKNSVVAGSECAVGCTGKNMTVVIESGTFTGNVDVRGVTYSGGTLLPSKLEISGGTFNDEVKADSQNNLTISGGFFRDEVSNGETDPVTVDLVTGGYYKVDPSKVVNQTKHAVIEVTYQEEQWFTLSENPEAINVTTGKSYPTLAKAITAATAGDTIKLLTDVDLTATQEISKNLTIDLNGDDITATGVRALWIKSGDVTITNSAVDEQQVPVVGTISANGEALSATSSVIRVGDSAENANKAKLTIDEHVTISSGKSFGVTVFGMNDDGNDGADMTLVVNGTVAVSGSEAAISGNGTSTLKATDITIGSTGNVTSENDYAIYHPGKGNLTVNGKVEGKGGIEAKGGTVTINSGANIKATASEQSHEVNNNGTSTSGYAIASIGNKGYVNGPAAVTNNGGTVNGKVIILAEADSPETGSIQATVPSGTPEDGLAWHKVAENNYVLAPVVAKIGDVGYASLAEAVEAAHDNDMIVMVASVTESVTIPADKTITLDLKGKTITAAANANAFVVSGTLTVKDTSAQNPPVANTTTGEVTYEAGKITAAVNAIQVTGGAVTVQSGEIASTSGQGISARAVETGHSTVYVEGGYVHGVWGVCVFKNAQATISGGVVVGDKDISVSGNGLNNNGTSVTISGGTIIGKDHATGEATCAVYQPQGGTLNISGGNIVSLDGPAVVVRAGNVSITGGTIEAKGSTPAKVGDCGNAVPASGIVLDVKAGYPGANSADKISITDDNVLVTSASADAVSVLEDETHAYTAGSIAVSAGAFSSKLKEEYCAAGYVPTDKVKEVGGVYYYTVAELEHVVAKIGTTYYATLADALAAVNASEEKEATIVLVNSTEENVTVLAGNTIVLDLNGKTLTAKTSDPAITNIGKLTLKSTAAESGKIVNLNGIALDNQASAIIEATVNMDAKTAFKLVSSGSEVDESALLVYGGEYRVTSGLITEAESIAQDAFSANFMSGTFQLGTFDDEGNFTRDTDPDNSLFPMETKSVVTVTGGRYSHDIDPQYWAEGKRVVETGGTPIWFEVISKYSFKLTVSSADPNMGTAAIKDANPSGKYVEGTMITVIATPTSGNSFAGWYVKDGTKTTLVSNEAAYTFPMPGQKYSLVAAFVANPSAPTTGSLEIAGPVFTVYSAANDLGVNDKLQTTSFLGVGKFSSGTSITTYTVTALATDGTAFAQDASGKWVAENGETFLYWRNDSNKIVSRNPVYSFQMFTQMRLTAVTTGSVSSAQIPTAFLSGYDQVLSIASYTSATTADQIVVPPVPSYAGRVFNGWSVNGTGAYTDNNELKAAIVALLTAATPPTSIDVKATYVVPEGTTTVTVKFVDGAGKSYADGAKDIVKENVRSGMFHIKVDEANTFGTGYYIEKWVYEGQVISNVADANIMIAQADPASPITLTATVKAGTRPTDVKPTVTIQSAKPQLSAEGKKQIVVTSLFVLPEGCTVVEKGLIRTTLGEADCTLASVNGSTVKKTQSSALSGGTYAVTQTLSSASAQTSTWYYCAYLIYSYNGAEDVIESTVLATSYDALTGNS